MMRWRVLLPVVMIVGIALYADDQKSVGGRWTKPDQERE
jgi:hypothetical protein